MLKVTEQGYGLGSDHAPFTLKGIPGIMPITWPDRYYHSSRDYLDKTDWNVFELITNAVVMTINALDKPEETLSKVGLTTFMVPNWLRTPLALKYWLIFSTAG